MSGLKFFLPCAALFLLFIFLLNASPASADDETEIYVVQPGDFLWKIAVKYETDVSVLVELNHLANSDRIKVGQKIRLPSSMQPGHVQPSRTPPAIPSSSAGTYIVLLGDTLWKIALQHNTVTQTLVALNGIQNPNRIEIGQEILLPGNTQNTVGDCIKFQAEVSAYSSTPEQTWGDPFITASGTRVHQGTIAAPPRFSFGTRIYIPGYGWGVVEDRGGKIYGNRFDVWMYTRWDAIQWGRQYIYIKVCN